MAAPIERTFKDYQNTLAPALADFEHFLQSQVSSFEPELSPVIQAVLAHPGKRLRPTLVFACAGIFQKPSPQALRLAAITELIHLATLIHDDILDGASTRHGAPSHHRLFNPQLSVLTGDTLFLRANEFAALEDDSWVGRTVAAAAKATCSGEIAQGLRANPAAPLSLSDYERQLRLKTGKLFGLSCALGGFLAKLSVADCERLARYGELFGLAYQLYDDAVDVWGSEADYKKTLGTDQTQHKWTLPWILLAQELSPSALAPLWANRPAALAAFQTHAIAQKSQALFDSTLAQASDALAGLPQAPLLSAPLSFVRDHWAKLNPLQLAVNQ